MNRQQFDQMQTASLREAVEALINLHPALAAREVRLRSLLTKLQQESASNSAGFELLNIRTAEDLAPVWRVSVRRAQAIIRNRHERFGGGRQIGRTWCLSAREWEGIEIDATRRRKTE